MRGRYPRRRTMNDERCERNACFHWNMEHTRTYSAIPRPFSRLWHAWLWKVAPVRQGCRPADLLRAAWIQKYASLHVAAATMLVYAPPWPSLVPRFTPPYSSLPFILCMYGQRGGSRSWVALPPNKLSPPRHLHKSIKSALVEFEASRPPLVIYRYETRIGAGENVRQMFARLESILHLGWVGRSFLLSLLFLFYSFVVLVLCNCFMWLVKKFSFRRAR